MPEIPNWIHPADPMGSFEQGFSFVDQIRARRAQQAAQQAHLALLRDQIGLRTQIAEERNQNAAGRLEELTRLHDNMQGKWDADRDLRDQISSRKSEDAAAALKSRDDMWTGRLGETTAHHKALEDAAQQRLDDIQKRFDTSEKRRSALKKVIDPIDKMDYAAMLRRSEKLQSDYDKAQTPEEKLSIMPALNSNKARIAHARQNMSAADALADPAPLLAAPAPQGTIQGGVGYAAPIGPPAASLLAAPTNALPPAPSGIKIKEKKTGKTFMYAGDKNDVPVDDYDIVE